MLWLGLLSSRESSWLSVQIPSVRSGLPRCRSMWRGLLLRSLQGKTAEALLHRVRNTLFPGSGLLCGDVSTVVRSWAVLFRCASAADAVAAASPTSRMN
jgi:hypothetical protein